MVMESMPKYAVVEPKADWLIFRAVLLKPASGILLPDSAKGNDALSKYIVVAVGPKVKRAKVGDEIIILPHTRLGLKKESGFEPETFLTRDEEICAVVKR